MAGSSAPFRWRFDAGSTELTIYTLLAVFAIFSEGISRFWFAGLGIATQVFIRLQSSAGFIRPTLEWAEVLMRIRTSKSKVACPPRVRGQVLPQTEELEYLRVLFTSEERTGLARRLHRYVSMTSESKRQDPLPVFRLTAARRVRNKIYTLPPEGHKVNCHKTKTL
ncbi:uncharacterized protein LOC144092134 [Stigmatopora argus]